MIATFDDLVAKVLEREGGFTDNPSDRGGQTNYGITQHVYSGWLGKPGDVKAMAKHTAIQIYFELYWNPSKCALLPDGIRDIHFDSSINHGVGRASKLLQTALRITADGLIGSMTIAAAAAIDIDLLVARYIAARYAFYGSIVARDKSQLVFIAGWMNRMKNFS